MIEDSELYPPQNPGNPLVETDDGKLVDYGYSCNLITEIDGKEQVWVHTQYVAELINDLGNISMSWEAYTKLVRRILELDAKISG